MPSCDILTRRRDDRSGQRDLETIGFQRVGDGFSSRIWEPSLSPHGDAAAWVGQRFAGIYETKSKQTRLITATPNPAESREPTRGALALQRVEPRHHEGWPHAARGNEGCGPPATRRPIR